MLFIVIENFFLSFFFFYFSLYPLQSNLLTMVKSVLYILFLFSFFSCCSYFVNTVPYNILLLKSL